MSSLACWYAFFGGVIMADGMQVTIGTAKWFADDRLRTLRDGLTFEEWKSLGRWLGSEESLHERQGQKLYMMIGAWWSYGPWGYGERKAIVDAPDWMGPSYRSCRLAGLIYRRFGSERDNRLSLFDDNDFNGLTYGHYAAAANAKPAEADRALRQAAEIVRETGKPPPVRMVTQFVKRERRETREVELAEVTKRASRKIGKTLYSVILADPPWRWEPYSRTTGMDRVADNHYSTMTTAGIA
jgi:hypothetical protein